MAFYQLEKNNKSYSIAKAMASEADFQEAMENTYNDGYPREAGDQLTMMVAWTDPAGDAAAAKAAAAAAAAAAKPSPPPVPAMYRLRVHQGFDDKMKPSPMTKLVEFANPPAGSSDHRGNCGCVSGTVSARVNPPPKQEIRRLQEPQSDITATRTIGHGANHIQAGDSDQGIRPRRPPRLHFRCGLQGPRVGRAVQRHPQAG